MKGKEGTSMQDLNTKKVDLIKGNKISNKNKWNCCKKQKN